MKDSDSRQLFPPKAYPAGWLITDNSFEPKRVTLFEYRIFNLKKTLKNLRTLEPKSWIFRLRFAVILILVFNGSLSIPVSVKNLAPSLFSTSTISRIFSNTAFASSCTDKDNPECEDDISSLISDHSYGNARELAEERCWPEELPGPLEQLGTVYLHRRAEGCLYLYSIEKFFSNNPAAIAAKDEAKKIATWACQQGREALCRLLGAIGHTLLEELMADFSFDMNENKLPELELPIALRVVNGTGKLISRTLINDVRDSISKNYKSTFNKDLPNCKGCSVNAKSTWTKFKVPKFTRFLDVNVVYDGMDLGIHLKIVSAVEGKTIKKVSYESKNIENRMKYFGFKKHITARLIKSKKLNDYKATFKTLIGLGLSKVPNVNGNALDDAWHSIQIRTVERFNKRRSEFGIIFDFAMSDRTVVQMAKKEKPTTTGSTSNLSGYGLLQDTTEDGIETETVTTTEEKLEPFEKVFSFYAIYSHMLTAPFVNYDGMRVGLHVGIGRFFGFPIIAPIARTGLDLYFGRHFALSMSYIYRVESNIELNSLVEKSTAVGGGEFTFSYNL